MIELILRLFGYVKADRLPIEDLEQVQTALTYADLLAAIRTVESGNKPDGTFIPGDDGEARGPLQIWEGYHSDSVGNLFPYPKVDYWKFALRCWFGYMARYAPVALLDHDFELLARVHNGGPAQLKRENWKRTDGYWKKVSNELDRIKAEKSSRV